MNIIAFIIITQSLPSKLNVKIYIHPKIIYLSFFMKVKIYSLNTHGEERMTERKREEDEAKQNVANINQMTFKTDL